MFDRDAVKNLIRPKGLPFRIGKIGHVVLNVRDVERSVRFYTEVLGFEISDLYPEDDGAGGMVFLRCNPDHHGIALVGSLTETNPNAELNHIAFEVGHARRGDPRPRPPRNATSVQIDFAGRRRAGCQIAVEFRDPDNHRLEIYWGIDQIGSDGQSAGPRGMEGRARHRGRDRRPGARGRTPPSTIPALLKR